MKKIFLSALLSLPATSFSDDFDLIIYGGSPSGVAAAVAAAEENLKVLLISENETVGGAMSNGLSATDIGAKSAISGIPMRFFEEIRKLYGDSENWRFEPKIAEEVFLAFLEESEATMKLDSPLNKVTIKDEKIVCITLDTQYCADTFIDSSYTGDLIYQSGANYRLGMEDLLDYGESYANSRQIIEYFSTSNPHQFSKNPFIDDTGGPVTEGMPSITYRTCVTKKNDKIPFSRTDNYDNYAGSWSEMVQGYWDRSRFSSLQHVETNSIGTINSPFYQIAKIPNDKYDLNSGWSSFMNVTTTEDYFNDRNYRNEFQEDLKDYMQNWLYFLQNDPSVPEEVKLNFEDFGICSDEFLNNGGWPAQPYLREGRRLVGEYTMTQDDIYSNREKKDAVALSSYHIDSKLTQIWQDDGMVYRDYGAFATTPIYEFPYSSMLPEKKNPYNLLVTVGVSASPVAYGSLRMEPQYMAYGEAAGTAAAIAHHEDIEVSEVNYEDLQNLLDDRGVIYKAKDACLQKIPSQWRDSVGFSKGCEVIPQQ